MNSFAMGQPAQSYEYSTWEDYQGWPDDERWELIDGQPFAMTPGPGFRHQDVCLGIGTELRAFLRGKPCHAIVAPFDVKLSDADIVQPDVLVVCDQSKITDTHLEGAPDMVVEIGSPSTNSYDRTFKLSLYAKYGVKEYWLVTPYPPLIEVLLLDGDSYRVHSVFAAGSTLASPTLQGLAMVLDDVFDFPVSEDERVEEIRESTPPYGRAPRSGD
jgi:Uma2 family endonuclease